VTRAGRSGVVNGFAQVAMGGMGHSGLQNHGRQGMWWRW